MKSSPLEYAADWECIDCHNRVNTDIIDAEVDKLEQRMNEVWTALLIALHSLLNVRSTRVTLLHWRSFSFISPHIPSSLLLIISSLSSPTLLSLLTMASRPSVDRRWTGRSSSATRSWQFLVKSTLASQSGEESCSMNCPTPCYSCPRLTTTTRSYHCQFTNGEYSLAWRMLLWQRNVSISDSLNLNSWSPWLVIFVLCTKIKTFTHPA